MYRPRFSRRGYQDVRFVFDHQQNNIPFQSQHLHSSRWGMPQQTAVPYRHQTPQFTPFIPDVRSTLRLIRPRFGAVSQLHHIHTRNAKRPIAPSDEEDPVASKKLRGDQPSFSQEECNESSIQDISVPPKDYSVNAQITEEIISLFIRNHQTEEIYNQKLHLRDALHTILREALPNCGLYICGSTMSGFSTLTSDVDLCLMLSNLPIDQKTEAPKLLNIIRIALSRCSFLSRFEVIRAKVPILKMYDRIANVEIDLNINNAVGIRNTHLLKYYSIVDWRVRPLILFVKKWARFQDINDAFKNTLSSYSLSLMVIHYLQCGVSPPVLPALQKMYPDVFSVEKDIRELNYETDVNFKSENNQSLGDLLLGFLEYYTNKFDYDEDCISVRLGLKTKVKTHQTLVKKPRGWQESCLNIEEPFDLSNAARACFNKHSFDRVKRVIRVSHNRLKNKRDIHVLLSNPF